MNWKNLIAVLLLLQPLWWLGGLLSCSGALEFAEHMIVVHGGEGEDCNEMCVHPTSLIDPAQVSATVDIPFDERAPHEQLIALLPHPHAARDRPPPLLYSLSHSLRAPPTLILA